jgi:PBP1b-binding outer membrane lipoprotein LpoB
MKKTTLLAIAASILLLSGCTKQEDPKETATKVCKALQLMDFNELKKYTDEESTKEITAGQKKLEEAKTQIAALPKEQRDGVQKVFDAQMGMVKQKMSEINCTKITIEDGADKESKTAMIDGKPTKLKLIDHKWKLTK